MGCKVGVLDADIYGPSIPSMFDLEGERPLSVNKENGKSKMAPIENHGVKILSIGFFTKGRSGSNMAWSNGLKST